MKLAVGGTGYVGLVTRVTLSEIGHHVTCIDIDDAKVEKMRRGISPIYEPGLSELMSKNIEAEVLSFEERFNGADIIYTDVGPPENEDGSANLMYVENVTKSTVPVGTNDRLRQIINHNKLYHINIEIVSNLKFSKEESAIYDSFYVDRSVIERKTLKAKFPVSLGSCMDI